MKYKYFCNNDQCTDYKKQFEVIQKITEDKLKTCNCCKEDKLEKVIEAPFFKFTGVGVYSNGTQ